VTRGHTIAALLLLACGCSADRDSLSPAQREAIEGLVSKEAPTPDHRLDIRFGRDVRLLGYDLDATSWEPGTVLPITWIWAVDRPPGEGWRLFTQIEGGVPPRTVTSPSPSRARWLYGPSRWQAGEFVKDEQEIYLPDDWSASSATLYVGIERNGKRRSRAKGPTVSVTSSMQSPSASTAVPTIRVRKTARPPRLDGMLEERAWKLADRTRPFVETRAGGPASVHASARFLWDDRYLYVAVEVDDALLRASDRTHDAHLWKQDCIELMLEPKPDRGYAEIQVSPRGVVFDTLYDSRRRPKPYGRIGWQSDLRSAVSLRGGIDDLSADAGYTVELAIPWHAFSVTSGRAPTAGDRWRANVFVRDLGTETRSASAWSAPLTGDFHIPSRFGIVAFEPAPDQAPLPNRGEPIRIPPERATGGKKNDPDDTPRIGETLIKRRVITGKRVDRAGGATAGRPGPRLESDEGAH